ncbi:MAG TPA: hypothetical protein VFA57_05500 [Pseudolabrys sp.]|jgi:hypothetical protein|nr:hypothetical protein [Pseudolabrys sp.]
MSDDPRFEARPNSQLGQGWCVHVFWRSGKSELITGFINQYQALEWIKQKSANWIADKIMQDPDYPNRR